MERHIVVDTPPSLTAAPRSRRRWLAWVVAVVVVASPLAAAWGQPASPASSGGRQTEQGWNPGTARESLAFGARMAVLGMGVVFTGLVLVYLFLVGLRRALERPLLRRSGEGAPPRREEISAEVAHAIALALFMDLRAFDEETAQEVTIRKITRPFSPWMDSGKTRVLLNNQLVFKK